MNIIISGGSGFIGTNLAGVLAGNENYNIIKLYKTDYLLDEREFVMKFEDVDVVINLVGANISKRWTKKYKEEIYLSRIETTKKITNAIKKVAEKGQKILFISASATGIYSERLRNTEDNCEFSNDFLANVCKDWESEAIKAKSENVNVVITRFGVVLGKNGGALQKMLLPFKMGLGGTLGNGLQNISWVHIDDLINIFIFLLQNNNLNGVFNCVSPDSVNNKELTQTLAKILKRPAFFKIPEFALKMLYSEGADVLLTSKTAYPKRLIDLNFKFKYEKIEDALNHLLKI